MFASDLSQTLLPLQVFPLARRYFASRCSLFDSLSHNTSSDQAHRSLSIARTAHKLLLFSPETFAAIWNWKPFIHLCASQHLATRLHATRAIARFLGMDGWQQELLDEYLGVSCGGECGEPGGEGSDDRGHVLEREQRTCARRARCRGGVTCGGGGGSPEAVAVTSDSACSKTRQRILTRRA